MILHFFTGLTLGRAFTLTTKAFLRRFTLNFTEANLRGFTLIFTGTFLRGFARASCIMGFILNFTGAFHFIQMVFLFPFIRWIIFIWCKALFFLLQHLRETLKKWKCLIHFLFNNIAFIIFLFDRFYRFCRSISC